MLLIKKKKKLFNRGFELIYKLFLVLQNLLVRQNKTDVEQVNDLLKQLATETDIDSCVTSNSKARPLNQMSPKVSILLSCLNFCLVMFELIF